MDDAKAFAQSINEHIQEIRKTGVNSYSGIARALNDMGVETRNSAKWYPTTVRNYLSYETAI